MADNQKKGVNPAAAGVVGAVIGAAAASAAIALSDKSNRKKVGKAIDEIKTEGSKRLNQLKKAADQVREEAAKKLEQGKKDNNQTASSRVTKSRKS